MALYRCASCGSPHIMRDVQSSGYSYSKGFLGSLLFGTGGASAGVNGKNQTVYKCPDCGVTLSYSMSPEMMAKIERGLIDPTFPFIEWTALKKQFKNLENGVIDRQIEQDRIEKTESVEKISQIEKKEFITYAKNIADYMGKCGYFKGCKCIYDVTHLPPVEVYRNVCKDAKEFINHMPQFMSFFDMKTSYSSPNYEKLFGWVEVRRLMAFVIVLEYYEETGKPMPINRETAQNYFKHNMHLKDLALKCHAITDGSSMVFTSGSSFDPKDILFENDISLLVDMPGFDDELDWLYLAPANFSIKGSVDHLYPQLIIKDNRVQINHMEL